MAEDNSNENSAGPEINLSDAERVYIAGKLAYSDEFRASMLEDPVATLAQIGITVYAKDLPDEVAIPSKEELRLKLNEYLEGSAAARGVGFIIRWPHRC